MIEMTLSDGRRIFGPRELTAQVEAEQDWLQTHATAETRYALLADNGMAWAVADLALTECARLNVPIPQYFTAEQVRHVLDDAGVDVLLTDDPARIAREHPEWRSRARSPISGLYAFERLTTLAVRPELPLGTCKITYTSGSTGQAKGVCLDLKSLQQVTQSVAEVARPLDATRHLCLLPLATLLDNVATTGVVRLLGATSVVPSLAETGIRYGKVEVPLLLECIQRYQPHSLVLVPELLRILLAAISKGWSAPRSLRFIAIGGASVSPQLLQQAELAGLPVFEGYGLSECASVVSLNRPGAKKLGSAGRPLPHAKVRIDDCGEIHVAGSTMLGYLGSKSTPEEIATGDRGYFDDEGYLHVTGRLKNILITSFGRNISPEWIERELLSCPEIAQAVVVGDGRAFLSALLQPTSPAVSPAAMTAAIARVNAGLPDYAKLGAWRQPEEPFSVANGLLTANGRPRRPQIAEAHAELIASLYADSIKEVS
ncbi:MAG: AMP-binding protein [Steroidobacteraceae bacterium]|jgi:long-chain acyl-CoA synthetase|nr:long-chain acyl-CoA synthetase [Gammaproteobacteria bacterium]